MLFTFAIVKKIKEISSPDHEHLSRLSVELSRTFDQAILLNSNSYEDRYGKYELLSAFGVQRKIEVNSGSFAALEAFRKETKGWCFGHLSYELKDELEELISSHEKRFGFPALSFFEPKHLLVWKRGEAHAAWYSWEEEELESKLNELILPKEKSFSFPAFEASLSREEYLQRVNALKDEIKYGNIYEVNFCQNFSSHSSLDPYAAYRYLNQRSSMPFSAFYKLKENYLICASPERFMAKRGEQLICQPIKGTARRAIEPAEDEAIKIALKNDLKEQTENVMIVDLMRNDLSRTASRNSVKVEELFGVYTFPQVHQLISTVSSKLSEQYSAIDAIRYAFPMGSMTGAPKIKAMELIEKWEDTRRELYSGSVGYFDPDGDFDLNVVIRSLLYSAEKQLLSLTVGGAITDLAKAENEYDECLLKAKAIFDSKEAHLNES